MTALCKGTYGRRYNGPDGVIYAALYDLDGTCVVCEPYFKSARRRFAYLMAQFGFNRQRAAALLLEIDLKAAKAVGFERARFRHSMVDAYKTLCREAGRTQSQMIVELCRDIGNSPYFRKPELFPNVLPVLNRVREYYYQIAVTIGEREPQEFKIAQAGLGNLFDKVIVTEQDNKVDCIRETIRDLNIDPRYSVMVGNSKRSDGACVAVTNFAYLPLETGWAFDQEEIPQGTGFEIFQVSNWKALEERVLARLIRRRERGT